jgi:hypothetical protein
VISQRRRWGQEIATGEQALNAPQECSINAKDVLVPAMLFAVFEHQDAAVLFDDICGNFARVPINQDSPVGLAVDD